MGHIYLYTGEGVGKTTSAIGLALRALGHGYSVVIVQFMKGRETGEYKIRKKLKGYEIYQFGRRGWVDLKNPSEKDKSIAREGLKKAEEILRRKPFLLVLDEINLAVASGLLDVKDVLSLLDKKPRRTNIVLTGRYAPKELIEKADFAHELRPIKTLRKMVCEKGVQY
ncbi:MAG: cob(I)yrinic acid a,c-diamide adenosyltransferase [Candidatus Aenigmatarchaeota archaeon]